MAESPTIISDGRVSVVFYRGTVPVAVWLMPPHGSTTPVPATGDMVKLGDAWYTVSVRGFITPTDIKVQVRPWQQAGDIEAPFHVADAL